jgi:replicative DNA helicase
MFDYDVLALLSNKQRHDQYKRYVKEHTLQPETNTVIKVLGDYYSDNSAVVDLDWSAFNTYFWVKKAGAITPTNAPVYRNVLAKMLTYTSSKASEDLLKQMIECDAASHVAEIANDVVQGKAKLEEIDAVVKRSLREVGRLADPASVFAKPSVASVIKSYTTTGWRWRLECLNESLGPLRQGDHVMFAARVEVGKTTMAASEVTFIAEQMQAAGETRPIIWVNNEEQSDKVVFRVYQSALCRSTADITSRPDEAEDHYDKLIGANRIRITDGSVNSVHALDSLFVELNPCLIVFDQLDKVEGFYKTEKEVERLGKIYKWAREVARNYGPVITISQLSADADDPSYDGSYTALRGSKVDKPGELDVIITIGKDKSGKFPEHARVLTLTKNKALGPLNEDKRHATHLVYIDPVHARYYD